MLYKLQGYYQKNTFNNFKWKLNTIYGKYKHCGKVIEK